MRSPHHRQAIGMIMAIRPLPRRTMTRPPIVRNPHGLLTTLIGGLVLMLMTLVLNVIGFFLTRKFREAY